MQPSGIPLAFSQFKPQEFTELCHLITTIFNISESELLEVYDRIQSTFDEPVWPPHLIRRDIFQSKDAFFQDNVYLRSPVIAVDLPSSFELDNGNQNKTTIAIIAQDPKSNKDSQDIPIGTPFGLHHKGSREVFRTTKYYFEMISVLLEMGHRVYLTDVFKIWVCDPKRPYNRVKLPVADKNTFFEALEKELSIIKPALVVTWGKDSSDAVSKVELNVKRLSFPHPSGAAGGAWKQLLECSPTRANKLAYWQSSITQALRP